MFETFVDRLVGPSIRRPWLTVALSLLLAALALWFAITHFAINTDTAGLLSRSLGWRQDQLVLQQAFPQRFNSIVAVVDGASPEIAEEAAGRLAGALEGRTDVLKDVRRPDSGPFFEKNGLLFLTPEALQETSNQLIRQQGLLGPLAADPTLRGVMDALGLGLRGIESGEAKLSDLAPAFDQIAGTLERATAGEPARLSWRMLLSGGKAEPRELRKFVLMQPIQNFNALKPSAASIAAVREAIHDLKLTPENGVRVRLTGTAPVADDEFGTVAEDAWLTNGLTLLAIAVVLFLALRSPKLIVAVLATTFLGLVITAGLGLLVVGEFNLISIAFTALFVGLGVDFGIQFAVRYRAERHADPDLKAALMRAGRGVGWSLTLAAVSLVAGFFSFLPTAFRGVSELGLIAGMGMVVAWFASLTFLPALLALMRPAGEAESLETHGLAAVDHWLERHRRLVLIATFAVVAAGIPFLLKLPFDSNPMNLRSPKVESVATYLDLVRNPQTSPNTVDVLVPAEADIAPMAQKLAALPEVARTSSLLTFVPSGQEEKLAIIQDLAMLMSAVLSPAEIKPAPSDTDQVAALRGTAEALRRAAGTGTDAPANAARRLAAAADGLAAAAPGRRAAADAAVATDLKHLLDTLRVAMTAAPVTREDLPPSISADWRAEDGRMRVEIAPAGDSNDREVLERFSDAVRVAAPHAAGVPISVTESGRTIGRAFLQAGIFALVAISLILWVALRSLRDVVLTLGPLVLATILTLEAATLIGLPLNFANIIALPLMLGVGVAFHIYYIIAWRAGVKEVLASSLTRAIFFSALTTGIAFGSLWFSSHPGTASMGELLALSLVFTLIAAFFIVPAFLGPPRPAEPAKAAPVQPAARAKAPEDSLTGA